MNIIYLNIRGCYGLTQSGRLANDLLLKQLNKDGYFEAQTTPGIRRHKWRTINVLLIVHDFGVEYLVRTHVEHLASFLKKYHEISEDWEGEKFAGINLNWDYTKQNSARTCRPSTKNYIYKAPNQGGTSITI